MENITFESIGFNAASLSQMDEEKFTKEIEHLLPPEKIKELYGLLHPAKPGSGSKPSRVVKR